MYVQSESTEITYDVGKTDQTAAFHIALTLI